MRRIVDALGRQDLLDVSTAETGLFGDGSDGSPVFDSGNTFAFATLVGSTYTLSRSIFCVDMTVGSGKIVATAGFKIFCTRTLTNNGTITAAGGTGGAGGAGGAAGTAGTVAAS